MFETHQIELEKLGLSTPEAQIYLALLDNGAPVGASALTARTAISRSNVYLTLTALADKGLIEEDAGFGRRFLAVPPDRALPSLVARKSDELLQCQRIAGDLAKQLESVIGPAKKNHVESEVIQVLRDPRSVAERFERLQLEAERQIDGFVKAPFFVRPGNPIHSRAFRKGVRYRGLYERAVLDAPGVKPYLSNWLVEGEEARIYDGELPHKLAIFDAKIVLMPLIRPGEQTRTVLIRHPQLAQTLTLAFEHLWEQAELIVSPKRKKISKSVSAQSHAKPPPQIKEAAAIKKEGNAAGLAAGRNGQRPLRRAKKLNL